MEGLGGGAAGGGASPSALRAKISTLVYECVYKAVGIVLQPHTQTHARIHTHTHTHTHTHASKKHVASAERNWFQLNIDTVEGVRQQLEPWARCLTDPLHIDIVLQVDNPNAAASSAPTFVLLERWMIHFKARKELSRDTRITTISKKMGIFLRSLYSYVRLLPTYQNTSRLRQSTRTSFRMYNPEKQPELGTVEFSSEETTSYSFPPIVTPLGQLTLQARYSEKLPFTVRLSADQGPAAIQQDVKIIQDYIPDYNSRTRVLHPSQMQTNNQIKSNPRNSSPYDAQQTPSQPYRDSNLSGSFSQVIAPTHSRMSAGPSSYAGHPLTRRHSSPIGIPNAENAVSPPLEFFPSTPPLSNKHHHKQRASMPIPIPENEEVEIRGPTYGHMQPSHAHRHTHAYTHMAMHMQRAMVAGEEIIGNSPAGTPPLPGVFRQHSKSLDSQSYLPAYMSTNATPSVQTSPTPRPSACLSTSPMQAPYGIPIPIPAPQTQQSGTSRQSVRTRTGSSPNPFTEFAEAAGSLEDCSDSPPLLFPFSACDVALVSTSPQQTQPNSILRAGSLGKQSSYTSSNTQTQAHLSNVHAPSPSSDLQQRHSLSRGTSGLGSGGVHIMELPEDPFKRLTNETTSGHVFSPPYSYPFGDNIDIVGHGDTFEGYGQHMPPFAAEDLVFSEGGDWTEALSPNSTTLNGSMDRMGSLLLAHQCETAPMLRSFMQQSTFQNHSLNSTAGIGDLEKQGRPRTLLEEQCETLDGFRAYRDTLATVTH